MRTLLIATHNPGKLREVKELVKDLPFTVIDLNHFPSIETVEESGHSFSENASLKATGYAKQAHVLTLADDSGLMVDALNGAPGVRSARYAGEGASDFARTEKLLLALADIPEPRRTARFLSAVAIADDDGAVITVAVGECKGRIADTPEGTAGFGFDPVFIPDGFDQTFGQLEASVKNKISHRARALVKIGAFLRTLTAASSDG